MSAESVAGAGDAVPGCAPAAEPAANGAGLGGSGIANGAGLGGSGIRRACRWVLTRSVRGRAGRGTEWGEALLGEFEETTGSGEALRWAASGLRVAWRERRRVRYERVAAGLPTPVGRRIGRWLAALVAVAVAGWLINWQVVTITYVPSGSMEPTVRIGDRVLVDRVAHHFAAPGYGDVVVLRVGRSDGPPVDMIKRVVGLPGDAIDCRAGRLFRNGTPVDEPYLRPGTRTDCPSATVPANGVYVLGDHREISLDSRQFGAVPRSDVTGRVLTRI